MSGESGEPRRTTPAEELAAGRTVTVFTVGVSMRPLLRERQTHVTVAPLCGLPRRGDILLYLRRGGVYVLHRCQRVREGGEVIVMRGDNTYAPEPIRREQVLGVVTHIYRRGRVFAVDGSVRYRLYVAFWNVIYPFRWGLVQLKRRMGRWRR